MNRSIIRVWLGQNAAGKWWAQHGCDSTTMFAVGDTREQALEQLRLKVVEYCERNGLTRVDETVIRLDVPAEKEQE